MPGNNNATRKKAAAISRVLSRKAHTAEEKRTLLRLARAIEIHGVNANHNAILAAENALGKQQEANYAAEKAAATRKNNGSKKYANNNGSKKPANSGSKHASGHAANNGKKPVKKWATVNTSRVMARR